MNDFQSEMERVMRAQGISRADLARILGVHPGNVTRVLAKNYNPTLSTMQKFARAVGKQLHVSFGDSNVS